MDAARCLLLAGAGAVAGVLNSVAGGGSLISFPAALAAGLPPVVANATNTVAMVPGSLAAAFAYRRELDGQKNLTLLLILPGIAGGLVGAAVLLHTSPALFDVVVPVLVLGATLLLAMQDAVARYIKKREATAGGASEVTVVRESGVRRIVLVMGVQFLLAIYGGYFGAGMGIVMLAVYAYLAPLTIHQLNAMKCVVAACVNGVSSVYFVSHGVVEPAWAILLGAGAIGGGFAGGVVARRISPRVVRRFVVLFGFAVSLLLAYRAYQK